MVCTVQLFIYWSTKKTFWTETKIGHNTLKDLHKQMDSQSKNEMETYIKNQTV